MASHVAVAVAITLATGAAVAAPAAAATAPCVAGVRAGACHAWAGSATFVADGDTLDVDLAARGEAAETTRVRITGINAMELRRYGRDPRKRRGECHAVAATARLEQLVRAGGGRVRLTARNPASRTGGRIRRSVAVRIGGRWRDLGRALVAEGHALWLPSGVEWAPNATYSALAARARARSVRLWDPAACGPSAGRPAPRLDLWVNADADGTDSRNVDGEWVKVRNPAGSGSGSVALRGWWLRDSFQRRFAFPPSAAIAPGATITVHAGRGADAPGTFHWGLGAPAFENPTRDARAIGDGAYLFDSHGNLRASMLYPCRIACSDPSRGALTLRAQARGDEHVVVRNTGSAPVSLEFVKLESPPHGYAFPAGTALRAGEALRVQVQGAPAEDDASVLHWNRGKRILDDAGDVVRLRTYDDIVVACTSWGARSC